MIRSMVHDIPSIDGYDQVAISCFTNLESVQLYFPDPRFPDICEPQIDGP
jgi:hypothetical protein